MTNEIIDFEKVVIDQIPLIDVRAPCEFLKGAFKNAVNLPLMDDKERHLVGICYKEKGNQEAVKLGHKLVSGPLRQKRIAAWAAQLDRQPESIIYCFRGGQRSQISQEWIYAATGKMIPRLKGGYKAFRNYLINSLSPTVQKSTPIVLKGYTGSGKTLLLKELASSIDLEGIANHRGSSFGKYLTPQPTQITFENNLAYALIQHRHKGYPFMIIEDEGNNIGKCYLPKPLVKYFYSGYFVFVDAPFSQLFDTTRQEYVDQSQEVYIESLGEEKGLVEWSNYILTSIHGIKKRLGGELHQRIVAAFDYAYQQQRTLGSTYFHREWISLLLKEYYDPMYNYQLQKNKTPFLFSGNTQEVLDYLKNREKEWQ